MKTPHPCIAAIILTRNEEQMIANCIETLRWCDQVLVVDSDSSDATVELARKLGAKVISERAESFAERRNKAMHETVADWVFYIDADERVTPQLSKEILVQIETTKENALAFWRENIMYGVPMTHGGWGEKVTRVFRKSAFKEWQGEIHESPVFDGEAVMLHTSLIHLTHRNTIDGLQKTISWTPIEARLLATVSEKKVTPLTVIRKGVMEILRRGVLKGGNKDGTAGWIEAIVQGINRMLVYIQVWEYQQVPSLTEKYQAEERKIAELWKEDSRSK